MNTKAKRPSLTSSVCSRHVILVTTFLVLLLAFSRIETPLRAEISKAPLPQADFINWTSQKINLLSDFRSRLDVRKAVGLIAVPTLEHPADKIENLKTGALIGAVYLPSGLTKPNLAPGQYTVQAIKETDQWLASFRNEKGSEVARAPAVLKRAPKVESPLVSLQDSICWRFDEAEFCI